MLTAAEVLDAYFLENRCMLLEIAATLDRHDVAIARGGQQAGGSDVRLEKIYQSLAILAERNAAANRTEQLLQLFSDPVDGEEAG